MLSTTILTCAFCGQAYPDGTPTHKHEALSAHIRVCEKHPIGIENRALRRALSFAASCIKSGEEWDEECEKVIHGALDLHTSGESSLEVKATVS